MMQIINGKTQLKYSGGNSDAFALIIDGKSLAYALDDDVKHIFLELAVGCASVICCRSSPKQKALVSFITCDSLVYVCCFQDFLKNYIAI